MASRLGQAIHINVDDISAKCGEAKSCPQWSIAKHYARSTNSFFLHLRELQEIFLQKFAVFKILVYTHCKNLLQSHFWFIFQAVYTFSSTPFCKQRLHSDSYTRHITSFAAWFTAHEIKPLPHQQCCLPTWRCINPFVAICCIWSITSFAYRAILSRLLTEFKLAYVPPSTSLRHRYESSYVSFPPHLSPHAQQQS